MNSVNRIGWTPLMQAARNGHSACVKTLVQFGADVLHQNGFGVCALSLAAAGGNLECVRVILRAVIRKSGRYFEINQPVLPVLFSILFNHIDLLRYFIRHSFSFQTKSVIGDLSSVTFACILKNEEVMSLFKRRGISPVNMPMNISADSTNIPLSCILKTPRPTMRPSLSLSPLPVPAIVLETPTCSSQVPKHPTINSPMFANTPLPSPIIPDSFASPFYGLSVETIGNKLRKFSNLSISPSPSTPNLSPILFADTPIVSRGSYSSPAQSTVNKYLNARFSISPQRSLSCTYNNDTSSMPWLTNDEVFLWPGQLAKPGSKSRSTSCVPRPPSTAECEDDVFTTPVQNNEFIDLLRRNSLDSCISLFVKHEIDMDLFLTLSRSDLEEIGVDWDKRDNILELIYLINKSK